MHRHGRWSRSEVGAPEHRRCRAGRARPERGAAPDRRAGAAQSPHDHRRVARRRLRRDQPHSTYIAESRCVLGQVDQSHPGGRFRFVPRGAPIARCRDVQDGQAGGRCRRCRGEGGEVLVAGGEPSAISRRVINAPMGYPAPIGLPRVTRSGVMPDGLESPQLAVRPKPIGLRRRGTAHRRVVRRRPGLERNRGGVWIPALVKPGSASSNAGGPPGATDSRQGVADAGYRRHATCRAAAGGCGEGVHCGGRCPAAIRWSSGRQSSAKVLVGLVYDEGSIPPV